MCCNNSNNLPSQSTSGIGLDLLRCESLNALDAVTCSRVLEKNYMLLCSMAPLHRDVRSVVRFGVCQCYQAFR